jgi:hypothetical protein
MGELVVAHRHAEPEVAQVAQSAQQVPVGVGPASDGVDVAGAFAVAAPPVGRAGVGLAQVVLQLRADDGDEPEFGEPADGTPEDLAGPFGARFGAVRLVRLAEALRHARLPRDRGHRGQVGPDADVGQARVETAGDVDDVALRAGVEHRTAGRGRAGRAGGSRARTAPERG